MHWTNSAILFKTLCASLKLIKLDKDDVIAQAEARHFAGDVEGGRSIFTPE